MARTNRPELDELPEQKRNAILEGADAISTMRDFARRSFDMWMTIARGLAVLREVADQRTSRTAFKHLCKDHGYGTLNEATRSRLLLMAKHETAVRIWRETELTEHQRERWNSPTSICNRCSTLRAAIGEASKNKPPQPARKSNKPLVLERTLDTLLDCLQEMDADNRRAVLERILSPFGYAAMTKAETPTAKRKAAAAEPNDKAPLVWNAKEVAVLGEHHNHSAEVAEGQYRISAAFDGFNAMKFLQYEVEFLPHGVALHKGTRLKPGRTLQAAKAIAAKDYASRN